MIVIAYHAEASGAILLIYLGLLAIPFAIALFLGAKTAGLAIAGWTVVGFLLFYLAFDLALSESVGVAIVVFLAPWLVASGVGLFFGRWRRQRT